MFHGCVIKRRNNGYFLVPGREGYVNSLCMSRVLYYDCFAGISGDMNLAALIDLGVPEDYLRENLSKLGLGSEFELHVEKAEKSGICGTSVHVHTRDHGGHGDHHGHHHHHRNFADIRKMIDSSGLDEWVKERSIRIFEVLAEAEGKVHGKAADEVHFHEVGAVDSIVDIVGSVLCIQYIAPDKLVSSTIELGSGKVTCAHGVMPVPAPATLLLSEFFPSNRGGTDHEATTPTGAAFIATMADGFELGLPGRLLKTGTGIGHRDSEKLPNILRVSLYEMEGAGGVGVLPCRILEANIDDMTPEHVSYLVDKLFEGGAMDAWQESIVMKKNRLAVKVCALAPADGTGVLREVFFKHSTTFGLREIPVMKYELEREIVNRATAYGDVRVKRACFPAEEGRTKEKAEFEDCRELSERHGVSIGQITDTIQREY